MDGERKGLSPAAASGSDAAIALAVWAFKPFAQILGAYFAISFLIIFVALVFDFLKLAFTTLKVVLAKRPEGTSFWDALAYEMGHGEETKGLFAFGLVLSIVGVALVYFSQKPEGTNEITYLISQNPVGVTGGLAFGVGLALTYWGLKGILKKAMFGSIYYEEPEVKKMKSEMMAAFKQGRTMDAINLFKLDVKSMTDQFAEADSLKFDFRKEEKELAEISNVFKRAEKYAKAGAIKEADAELNSARKKYDAIRPKIANKLRAYGRIKETINELKHLTKNIDDMLKNCGRNRLDVIVEEECYRKLDTNRTLLASESFWRDDNFKEALAELERLKGDFNTIGESLKKKLERYNELLSRKFPCLKCGKNMNLANSTCPSCGSNPSETMLQVTNDMVNTLEEQEKKLQEAKWLMNFESEESGLEEIQLALVGITKQVEKGELDRATSLLTSTKASEEALVSEMKEKLGLYEKLSSKVSNLKKKSLEVVAALDQNKRDNIDVKDEEAVYAKTEESASQEMIEGLCKSGAFSEAGARLEQALSEFDELTAVLSRKTDRYKGLSALLADLDKLYRDVATMAEQAKAKKLDVSVEERDLRAININSLANRVRTLSKESETEINDAIVSANRIKASVGKKTEMFSRLEGMASALEEKVGELRALVSKGITLKLDIKEEHEKFYTIKMDRIREMLKSCDDIAMLKRELDNSLDTAQWCIASLSDKLANVEEAPKWSEAIRSAMRNADMVALDSLRAIPKEWRQWAAERYIESNPADAFALFDNKLVKTMTTEKKRRYEEVLNEIIGSGKVRGCALFDDRGVVVASIFPELNDTMSIGTPAADVADNGAALTKAVGIAKGGQCVIGTEEFKVVISELGKGFYLLCSLKPKENVAFTNIVISGGIKKLQDATA